MPFRRFLKNNVRLQSLVFAVTPLNASGAGTLTGDGGQVFTTVRSTVGTAKTAANGSTIATVAIDSPRVEPAGILSEIARTNTGLRSQEFDNAAWTKGAITVAAPIVTANSGVAPDGTTTADQIAFPAVSNVGTTSQTVYSFSTAIATYTISVWLRAATPCTTYLFTHTGGLQYQGLTTCSVTTTWQRFTLTWANGTAAQTRFVGFGVDLRSGSGQSAQPAHTVEAWGFQQEVNSAASSYIATVGTSVTKSADVITVPSTGWPTSTGEVTVDVTPNWGATGATHSIVDTRQASNIGWYFNVDSSNQLSFWTSNGSGTTTASTALTWTPGTAYVCRAVWGAGRVTLYRDGVQVAQTASGADLPASIRATAYVGCNYSSATQLSGNLANLKVYA